MGDLPAARGDFADPFVLPTPEGWLAFATNAGGDNVQVRHSADLQRWTRRDDALPRLARWAAPGATWAPSVRWRGGSCLLYVTVRDRRSGRQAITVASAASPADAFVDTTRRPVVLQERLGGSIDPSPFVDADGSAYLLWKADANALRRPSSVWIAALDGDGRRLAGAPVELLRGAAGWEDHLIEAPALVAEEGCYYLFYSANRWDTAGYAIGYATADQLLGPYRRVTVDAPWLGSDAEVAGPGGQEFFRDRAGALRMAYHGWDPAVVGYRRGGERSLRIATVELRAGRARRS